MDNCKKKRTLFNLFEVTSCEGCGKYLYDEQYKIGDNSVNIYYLGRKCIDNKYNEKYIANNILLKKFIIECIKLNNNSKETNGIKNNKYKTIDSDFIIIWLDIKQKWITKNDDFLYDLLEFDKDIHILVF